MAKKQKYYVVWKGVDPGIYQNWEDCQLQIKGVPDAKYKAFHSLKDAREAFESSHTDYYSKKKKSGQKSLSMYPIVEDSISVDAACSGNPGIVEYRGVDTMTQDEIFRQGPFQKGTNNIGEFLAIVHALALCNKTGNHKKSIYSDSKTAIKWVKNKKANTKLIKNKTNASLFELIRRAEKWLKENNYKNLILKWDTENWGEIPADFGRK